MALLRFHRNELRHFDLSGESALSTSENLQIGVRVLRKALLPKCRERSSDWRRLAAPSALVGMVPVLRLLVTGLNDPQFHVRPPTWMF
jgi:hypothetical protein